MYRVELDLFTGPLDLLLYLVRRNEVDIRELPIARLTRQFQEFIEVLEFLDLDLVGDFVAMASTLVEVKSRMVLDQPEEEEEPVEAELTDDPRSGLVEKLLEYKRFKEAATALEERAAEWQERYPRLSDDRPGTGRDPASDRIKEVELWDLVSALGRVLQRKEVEEHSSIRYDETPIQVYVEQIGDLVRREQEVRFTSLFEGETLRSKIVGMFLAVLELVRHHGFRAEQPVLFGEIIIRPPLTDGALREGSELTLPEVDVTQSGHHVPRDQQSTE
ncbi:MAG: segregation/condensation protein A [Planctomycetaceae bacterium]|nr:segregation/condensation protein A [Planctomycetaceae bacterium]